MTLIIVPPLTLLALQSCPDDLSSDPHPAIHPSPALLDALPDSPDPRLWATLVQLVHPLPPHLHDKHVPLDHPDLPLLQRLPHSQHSSLVTLLALPNCAVLRDADVANLRSLHRLAALDLRACPISSYALTALARGLDPSRSGTWGLRLLSLHGCPNIDDDVLPALLKFPLLSAIDLRFTRCTPYAVTTHLPAFHPSHNNSLFHPAPLALALYSLEKVALTAPEPIALYPCPPQSVFRLHIDSLSHRPSQNIPFAKDALPKNEPPASNVSSFYENSSHSKKNILPLSAQAVHPSNGTKLDPLAIARLPPPWSILDSPRPTTSHPRWIGQALDKPLKVDPTRLHKRGSDAVADMVRQFTNKQPKVESEFALEKTRKRLSVKSRNPFLNSPRSVFAESSTSIRDEPRSPQEAGLRVSRPEGTKPLKPITSLKPPVLPKELRPSLPKLELKQTRLAFSKK